MALTKKAVFLFVCFLLSLQTAFSQNPTPTETERLMKEIAALYSQARFDEAISRAEKLVKLERKNNNAQNVSTAVLNLAILRKERYQLHSRKMMSPQIAVREKIGLSEKLEKDGAEAEKLFREFLEMKRGNTKIDLLQTATAQNELAWIIVNFFDLPDGAKTPQARLTKPAKSQKRSPTLTTEN
jgi:tetratricopeptide (TPR) repeat protein